MITDVNWIKRMLSHNMRMPMSVITGYGELMKQGLLSFDEMEEVISNICDNINYMNSLLKVVIDDKRHKITKFALRFGEDNFNGNLDFVEYLKYLQEKYIKLLTVVPLYKRIEIKKELKMVKKAYKKWERSNERNIAIPKN